MHRLSVFLCLITFAFALSVSAHAEFIAQELEFAPAKPLGTTTVHHGQMFTLPWGWQVTDADSGCVIHYASVLFVPAAGFFPCFLYSVNNSAPRKSCSYGYYPGMHVSQARPTPETSFPGCATALYFQRLSGGRQQPNLVSGYFTAPVSKP